MSRILEEVFTVHSGSVRPLGQAWAAGRLGAGAYLRMCLRFHVGGPGSGSDHLCHDIHLRVLRDQWETAAGSSTQADFEAGCCPPNEPGEIVVSDGHVLGGYLHGQGR